MGNFTVFDFAPRSGPPGTVVTASGSGFATARVTWQRPEQNLETRISGDTELQFAVPVDAQIGPDFFSIQTPEPGESALQVFTVTDPALCVATS